MNDFQFDNDEIIGNWECDECGFTYRSAISERLGQCPQCGAPGESFSFWSDVEEEYREEELEPVAPEVFEEEDDEEKEEEEEFIDEFDDSDDDDY